MWSIIELGAACEQPLGYLGGGIYTARRDSAASGCYVIVFCKCRSVPKSDVYTDAKPPASLIWQLDWGVMVVATVVRLGWVSEQMREYAI